MPIRNAHMAEWAGEFRWTDQAIPTELYAFAEDNAASIVGPEGYHIASLPAGAGVVALLTCRIHRPAAIPGRPGLAYHHAIISDTPAHSAAMENALRSRYADPVDFTRKLYGRIASLGPQLTAERVIDAVRPLLESITVDENRPFPSPRDHPWNPEPSDPNEFFPPPPPNPGPTILSSRDIVRLLRLNATLLVVLIGLGVYQTVQLKGISARLPSESIEPSEGDTSQTDTLDEAADTARPPDVPEPPADGLEGTLRSGGRYLLDDLPSGGAFLTNPRTAALVSEIQQVLRSNQSWNLVVEVYTDQSGEPSTNLPLSQLRADSLAQRILSGGAGWTSRVNVIGRGEAATPGNPPIVSRQRRIVVSLTP